MDVTNGLHPWMVGSVCFIEKLFDIEKGVRNLSVVSSYTNEPLHECNCVPLPFLTRVTNIKHILCCRVVQQCIHPAVIRYARRHGVATRVASE